MTEPKQIKAYIQDASGQLLPLAADSLILEFPSGESLEIAWDTPHPDDPRPVCAQVWGGRRVPVVQTDADLDEVKRRTTPVAILPSAGNLVLVHPYSFSKHKHD
ncbi:MULTISPECIES: hypothetical protein [unclassified Paraburkholderia]|uniref:hypothetical protein n=1 Tax=unclassified Paraburkholderia TaxID=2615204 RepID=UPI00161ADB79|nr:MULTISPECIES: hypothetical protein [unclassified Paraburkholderia]MBB5413258.1 hypothetical protein [Paraburkholderia sp. HC6.4b]MBB5442387.1 hypothetical protein [Paraburkholderia sp. WSM4177]MBB5455539.1 hypothetical protein [Paraburkholderia sp. Kb1A]MBB5482805.1 hypothetical protein [Paraburkholderia sp. WSM4180]MBB5495883.1 hypothetical protein [Paraburkholderia sp. MM5384-R2]